MRPDAAPFRRRVWHLGLATVVACAMLVPSAPPARAALLDDIRSDADWILSARLPDGAIANYVDRQAVWPYLANFAAMGLARATGVTKDKKYVEAAWRWASWYQAHMDSNGFVNDYVMKNGSLVSTGFMDSSDAYAGTFLIAVRDIYRVDRSLSRLRTLRSGITRAVKAIEATQTADGLTWAKPTWKVKYLMDQGEAYAGLLAAVELAKILKDTALTKRATSDANRMFTGVAGLWNPGTQSYDWAVHEDGSRVATDWSFLYPDALQQPWAVAFGLATDSRATSLMAHFAQSQPKWASPLETSLFRGGAQEAVGFWPVAGLAFYRVGSVLAAPAVSSIRSAALTTGRAWPFTTGNAGQLILYEAYRLTGAITFDAKSATVVATTDASSTFSPASTAGPTPAPTASPAPTVTPPTPTPPVNVTAQLGPVTGEASAGVDGVDVYATASPPSVPMP